MIQKLKKQKNKKTKMKEQLNETRSWLFEKKKKKTMKLINL